MTVSSEDDSVVALESRVSYNAWETLNWLRALRKVYDPLVRDLDKCRARGLDPVVWDAEELQAAQGATQPIYQTTAAPLHRLAAVIGCPVADLVADPAATLGDAPLRALLAAVSDET